MARTREHTGQARAGSLADTLLTRIPGAPEGLALVRLWREWDTAVGPEIAAWAHPLGSHHGILRVGVEDAMGMHELVFYAPQILYDVHQFLGQELFDNVQGELLMTRTPLNATPAPPPALPIPSLQEVGELGAPTAIARLAAGDTPWARAYRAYVKMVTGRTVPHGDAPGETGERGD
ncbi:DciA family protein [Megalodesulfovibrio paquesii]